MRFFNMLILAVAASGAAIPTPVTEADIDKLRASGMSETQIASRFPHAHAGATLLRRRIDADGEVAPGRFSAPSVAGGSGLRQQQQHQHQRRAPKEVFAHAGLDDETAEGAAVGRHVSAVQDFIARVLDGNLSVVGNGGTAMRKGKREEGGEQAEVQQRPKWVYRW